MTLARLFILRTDTQAQALYSLLKANWRAMAADGKPLAVRVYEHRERRRTEQNALMWVRLGQIAEQAWVGGRQYGAEAWHEYFKERLLPDETATGTKKWAILPDGSRRLVMSTGDLNVGEFAQYLTNIEAYAASELGIELS
ncbi:hypothetical protein GCM10023144_01600 [Pigmentiphaga soli]|uniref:NinB family protein n=1 Tax=Pigmentiphaga soli TaxID=1007095 RepID=A0ABP8GCZ7_9BURK